MVDVKINVMTRDDILAEVMPHLNREGYTLQEWLEGCENWTIRDGWLRDLWIEYGTALS